MGGSEAAMAAVLREIVLRLCFPAFLVRAAFVSKRWLGLAADPAFLRPFRDRHPPSLLGFYAHDVCASRPHFVLVSEAPELRAAVRHAGFDHGDPSVGPFDCRSGRLLLQPGDLTIGQYVVRSPLCPMRSDVPVSPPPPHLPDVPKWLQAQLIHRGCFLSRDSSDGIVFVYLLLINGKLSVQVYILQSCAWSEGVLAEGQLPGLSDDVSMVMVAHGKLYMLTATDDGHIHGLDFVAPRPQFFTIKLPNEVGENYQLSSADDGGFFVIDGEGFQLSIWHHETHDNGEDHWELVDRYCVRAAHDSCEEILVLGGRGQC